MTPSTGLGANRGENYGEGRNKGSRLGGQGLRVADDGVSQAKVWL